MRVTPSRVVALALFCSLGLAAVAWSQVDPTVQQERQRLIDKMKEINRWGPDAPIVSNITKELDEIISSGVDATFRIGWGLTADGKAYLLTWKNKAFSFQSLTEDEAAKQGVTRMAMNILRPSGTASSATPPPTITQEQAFAKGLRFFIASASLGDPPGTTTAGQQIKGQLHFVLREGSTAGSPAVEFSFSVPGSQTRSYAYPRFPAKANEGEVTFDFSWAEELGRTGEVSGTLRIVAPPRSGSPTTALSNAVPVKLRIVK